MTKWPVQLFENAGRNKIHPWAAWVHRPLAAHRLGGRWRDGLPIR